VTTLIELAQQLAPEISITAPSAIVGSTTPDYVKALLFLNKTCEELERRVDWGFLEKTVSLVGTGAAVVFDLPSDFSRPIMGLVVTVSGLVPVRGGLSADEWAALPSQGGTPRFFRIKGKTIEFWPYLNNGASALVRYQSKNWNGAANKWLTDGDSVLLPEDLILMGTIARWRRSIGQNFADHAAEFEAILKDRSEFDERMRTP
jgi:hypothetical protein